MHCFYFVTYSKSPKIVILSCYSPSCHFKPWDCMHKRHTVYPNYKSQWPKHLFKSLFVFQVCKKLSTTEQCIWCIYTLELCRSYRSASFLQDKLLLLLHDIWCVYYLDMSFCMLSCTPRAICPIFSTGQGIHYKLTDCYPKTVLN